MDIEKIENENVYEISYWLISTLSDEARDETHAKLIDIITKNGGKILSEGLPELKDMAYPMEKIIENKRMWFTTGFFGFVKFEMITDNVNEAGKSIKALLPVIRTLLIKTVKEDFVPFKTDKFGKLKSEKLEVSKDVATNPDRSLEEDEVADVDEADLDEKLDSLISEE